MSQDGVRVTIRNWDTYNVRKDVKSCSWFRMNHNLYEDADFFDFTHTERSAWIYLLCQASQKNSGQVKIRNVHVTRIGQFKLSEFSHALKKLESIQCITVHGTLPLRERHATDRTDLTDKQTIAHFDFLKIYEIYPKKLGRAKGLAKLEKQIKTQEDFDLLLQAVERFKAHHEKEGTEAQFIPYFSTFVSTWREWLDPDVGTSSVKEIDPFALIRDHGNE